MIQQALESYNLFNEFLTIPLFDFLIGNTDRHHSNWALILENQKFSFCPLYDNSSSLCAYLLEEKTQKFLGKDRVLWKSLIDTKSRSRIRISQNDIKEPTHLQMLEFIREHYFKETAPLAESIISLVTEPMICDILKEYPEDLLNDSRKKLILKFLLSKVQLLKETYSGRRN